MRIGVSWPGTGRRRFYLSGGPVFWLIAGPILAYVYVAVLVVLLVVLGLVTLYRGVRRLVRR